MGSEGEEGKGGEQRDGKGRERGEGRRGEREEREEMGREKGARRRGRVGREQNFTLPHLFRLDSELSELSLTGLLGLSNSPIAV